MTASLNGGECYAEGIGLRAYDQRLAAFIPMHCWHPECHRYICTIDSMVRKYSHRLTFSGDGMLCLACKYCAGPWAWVHFQGPTDLERLAMEKITAVFGSQFHYVFEMRLPNSHWSVDIMLINQATGKWVAVQVDGRQHAEHTSQSRDAAMDSYLHALHVPVVRLPANRVRMWKGLLEVAYDWACTLSTV
jgi:hypothetical protein